MTTWHAYIHVHNFNDSYIRDGKKFFKKYVPQDLSQISWSRSLDIKLQKLTFARIRKSQASRKDSSLGISQSLKSTIALTTPYSCIFTKIIQIYSVDQSYLRDLHFIYLKHWQWHIYTSNHISNKILTFFLLCQLQSRLLGKKPLGSLVSITWNAGCFLKPQKIQGKFHGREVEFLQKPSFE